MGAMSTTSPACGSFRTDCRHKPGRSDSVLRGQLFARKTVDQCIADSEVGGGMRRTLGPVQLTALGIGAIIGAGIFAAIGTAITGDAGHVGARSAIVVSIVLAGVTSALAAIT